MANDATRREYLEPKAQEEIIVFQWIAYGSQGRRQMIHTREEVEAWFTDRWGILCHSQGNDFTVEMPEQIEQAIRDGFAQKAEAFR